MGETGGSSPRVATAGVNQTSSPSINSSHAPTNQGGGGTAQPSFNDSMKPPLTEKASKLQSTSDTFKSLGRASSAAANVFSSHFAHASHQNDVSNKTD